MKVLDGWLATWAVLFATTQSAPVLRGRVVADEGGAPIRNARVAAASEAIGSPVVLTDEDGQFALPASSSPARVLVSKTGYGRVESGQLVGGARVEIRLRRAA